MSKKNKKIRELMDAWQKVNKKVVAVSIAVIIMFALSWFIYFIHLMDITSKSRELINDMVKAEVESATQTIQNSVIRKCSYVGNYAKGISERENITDGEIASTLHRIMEASNYVEVLSCDVNGKNVKDTSGEVDLDVARYINRYDGYSVYNVFDNEEHICTEDDSFIVVSPINSNNQAIGYYIAVARYVDDGDELGVDSEVRGDVLIVDDTGIIVSVVKDEAVQKINERYNFFNICSSYMNAIDFNEFVEKFTDSMQSGETGAFKAITAGESIAYIFHPLVGAEGWSIIYCVYEESINSMVNKILLNSVVMFLVIVMLMVLAAYIIIRHIQKEQQRVINLEYLDGLTGIMNRNAFTSKAEEILKENKNLPYYVSCFDIVNFRIINETYGHERSDVIIKALADACKEAFGKNEAFGRLNADVFVALVINDGEEEERASFLEGKVKEAAKKVYINHPIKIKKGMYEVVDTGESVSRMIDKANIARKIIGQNSKTMACKYSEDLMENARKTELIESQMERALRDGEFVPYLQAKFDMEKNHVCGAEALVRWKKPNGTLVPPGDFIPLFESNGFVEKIDFYMLEEICKYLRRMIDENREVYPVSVNQSRYLLNDPDYVSRVKDILIKYDIPLGLIELELTETVFFHERERMIDMMNELKYIHVRLSIDDFGSGYSSFNLLKDVPFDVLKIDREFLSDSSSSEKGKWILKEIVEMANGLGMDVICEGVETNDQAEMLLSIGCKHAQGFLYARPVPKEDFIEKYNELKEDDSLNAGDAENAVALENEGNSSDNASDTENAEDAEKTSKNKVNYGNTVTTDDNYITNCMW